MKKLLSVFAIASLILISCGESTPVQESNKSNTEVVANASIDLNVEGMACQHNCAGLIQKEVAKMSGVADCKVDFENKSMSVQFDDKTLNVEDIQSKVHSLGEGQYKTSKKEVELKETVIDEEVEEAIETVEVLNAVHMSANKMIYLKQVMNLFESVINNAPRLN